MAHHPDSQAHQRNTRRTTLLVASALILMAGCSNPQPGPDKSIAGALLGAGWGAGTGAIIGNQVDNTGAGVGVGAGLGAAGGLLTGIGFDLTESVQLRHSRELASLKVTSVANRMELERIQDYLDRAALAPVSGGVEQVFFDENETSLRAGSIANLEVFAEAVRRNPRVTIISVVGHSDDSGKPEENDRLSEARARAVSAYLAAKGVALDQIKVSFHGAKRPVSSNANPAGRQMNRRVDVFLSR